MATSESDCQTISIIVESGWTLSSIALNYNVTMASIREYNRMSNDVVYEGMPLIIPLCARKPTEGPTPTPTPAPPYPAPTCYYRVLAQPSMQLRMPLLSSGHRLQISEIMSSIA